MTGVPLLACFAVLLLGAGGARAAASDEQGGLSTLTIEELLQLPVASATLGARTLRDTPATAYVVTAEMIRERGYLFLYDALRDAPGLEVTWMGGLYGPILMARGIDTPENNKLLVLVDGVVDNNLSAGTAQVYMQYALAGVERIEVVYGPGSALFGANAMTAVVNLVTRTGRDLSGLRLHAGGMSWDPEGRRLGALGGFSLGRGWGTRGRGVEASLSASYVKTDGPDLRLGDAPRSDRPQDPAGATYYFSPAYIGAAEDGSYLLQGRLRLERAGLGFGGQVWEHRGGQGTYAHEGFAALNGLQDRPDVWNFRHATGFATWERALSKRLTNAASATWRDTRLLSDSRDLYFTVPGTGPDGPGAPGAAGSRYYRPDHALKLEERLTFSPGERSSSTVGFSAEWQRVSDYQLAAGHSFAEQRLAREGPEPQLDDDRRFSYRDLGAYAEQSLSLSARLTFTGGLRLDSFRLEGRQMPRFFGTRDLDAGGRCLAGAPACVTEEAAAAAGAVETSGVYYVYAPGERTRTTLNPRLGLVWTARRQASPSGGEPQPRLTVKALYGEGFRMPTVRELFSASPSRLVNPALDAEKVRTAQLSALWRAGRDGVLEAALFYTRARDIVQLAPGRVKRPGRDAVLNQFQNVGEPHVFGLDLGARRRLGTRADLFGHYSFQDPRYQAIDAAGRAHDPATADPTDTTDAVPRQARHKALLGASLRLRGGRVVITPRLRLVGARPGVVTSELQEVPAYAMLNLAVVLQDLLRPGLSLRVVGYNLTAADVLDPGFRTGNKRNDFPSAHPQPGFNLIFDVGYRFAF